MSAGSTPPAGSTRSGRCSGPAAGRRTRAWSRPARRWSLGALVVFSLRAGDLGVARDITVAGLLGIAGLAIVVGPWVYRLSSDLTAERAERVRTQERADLAAHLHDSVLQTLALIQKNAGDAAAGGPAGPRPRSATCGPGSTPTRRATTAPSRPRCAGWRPPSRTPTGSTVDVVTRGRLPDRPSRCGRWSAPPARRSPTPPSTPGTGRVDVYAEVSAARGRRLRPRPGRRLRPRRRAGGPVRRAAQHHRPHGAARRRRRDPLRSR